MSSVWPRLPFLALRGAQIFFAIIVLGLAGYVGSITSFWSAWFSLVTALFTLILVGFLLVAFFIAPAFTAPIFTLGIDAFLWLFWTISLGGWADQFTGVLRYSGDCGGSTGCGSVKGGMAMIVFEFLLFLATLGLSGWYFFQERRGGKTTATVHA